MPAHRFWMKGGASGRAINLYHSSECDDEDTDGKCPCADTHKQGLEPETKQRSNVHFHEPCFQIHDDRIEVDARIRNDHARCAADHALRDVKDCHHDIPCVGDDEHRRKGLENPLIEHKRLKIVEIVAVDDHLDQLDGHDKRENYTGDGHHDRL